MLAVRRQCRAGVGLSDPEDRALLTNCHSFECTGPYISDRQKALDHWQMCAVIKIHGSLFFAGPPEGKVFHECYEEARMAHSEKLTGTVDMFWPGECSASDNGAETHLREVESQIRHEEPIEPFTSNMLNRLRARRAKGTPSGHSEEEALADSLSACRGRSTSPLTRGVKTATTRATMPNTIKRRGSTHKSSWVQPPGPEERNALRTT